MVAVVAEWGSYAGWRGTRRVASAEAARRLCAEIEEHADAGPLLVGFTAASGHFFALGLGADDSCAMYWESVNPPYFQSVGGRPVTDSIAFAYDGHDTELPGTARISRDSAFQALTEFMATGTRPECIGWGET